MTGGAGGAAGPANSSGTSSSRGGYQATTFSADFSSSAPPFAFAVPHAVAYQAGPYALPVMQSVGPADNATSAALSVSPGLVFAIVAVLVFAMRKG